VARASKEQAETNHRLVLENSAKLIRERGIDGVSVADLMESAGLTHGGFYGHFDSKEQLAGEACVHAFEQSVDRWTKRIAGERTPAAGFKAIVDGYVSTRNRDNPGTSCPAPALIGDVARASMTSPVRAGYREGIKRLLEILQSVEADDSPDGRGRTLAHFSMMVGAVALARAMNGDPLSDQFLSSAREALTPESNGSPISRRGGR
jgi:TetR/AcrR family transcriptional regulator, transcriptional repressor for nem operon